MVLLGFELVVDASRSFRNQFQLLKLNPVAFLLARIDSWSHPAYKSIGIKSWKSEHFPRYLTF